MPTFKLLFIPFFIFAQFLTSAQVREYKKMMADNSYHFYEVVDAANTYFDIHGRGKGSGWKNFERWKNENESKFFPTGERHTVDFYLPQKEYASILAKQSHLKNKTSFDHGWVELGPWDANTVTSHYSPGIGRVEDIWIDPTDANHLYLGSRSGGFWKTSDGGKNWKNTTDFLVACGVRTFDVNPFNKNEILIDVQHGGAEFTHGIYRSTDGGDTWIKSNFNPDILGWGGLGNTDRIYKIAYHPNVNNQVFLGTSKGLFVSNDNLKTWTLAFNGAATDIEFHPTKNNIIYAYRSYFNDRDLLKKSTDSGASFSNAGAYPNNNYSRIYLSVSPAEPDHVYAASSNGVFKSTDEGANFTALSNPNSSGYAFAVSDINPDYMIYGYVDLFASADGGQSFSQKTAWANQNNAYIHADLRIAECVNGVFYVGTDGYFAKSTDNGNTWTRLNDGTAIREFYAVGLSQGNYDINMAGSQDNGTSILNKDGWIEWNGGDGMEALAHPLNKDWMIGSWQFGSRNYTQNGGLTRNGCNNPNGGSGNAAWEAPLLQNPQNSMQVYHFSDTMYRGNDFGTQWTFKSDPGIGATITEAAIAESDSNVIAVARNNILRLTTDGGQSWKSIHSGLPNFSITDIAFDPKNKNTIMVTYNRYQKDNQKIFISFDQGATWTNITYNLGDMPLRTVVMDHSDSSYLYVGGEIGIYYKSKSATMWTLYNENFPNVTVKDLEIHYGSNTLRAATWGRGLWEYTLVGRNNYPSITHTTLTSTPTINSPKDGIDQYVTATIDYDGDLDDVNVFWSANSVTLDSTIAMEKTGTNTWKSKRPIGADTWNDHVYFKVLAHSKNGNLSETYTFDYLVREFKYCVPSGEGATQDYINYVDLEDINNTSNQEFYGDFTDQSTELELGENYTLEVGMNYVFNGRDSVTAWIDYNRNGDFETTEQLIFSTLSNETKKATSTFTVPTDATINKNLRLRVRSQYFTNPMSPCSNTPGEIEDYTIRLKEPEVNRIATPLKTSFQLSPNPAQGPFVIQLDQQQAVSVEILNMAGKTVFTFQGITNEVRVNDTLASGTYLVQVHTSAGTSSEKIVIHH